MDTFTELDFANEKNSKSRSLHPTAIIGKTARLGHNVSVGPYTVIEDGVSIGDDTTGEDHVHIGHGTSIGKNNTIFTGAVLGHDAQNKASTST